MKHLKGLQRTILASAVAALAFGAAPARAVGPSDTGFGTCIGSDTSGGGGAGNDCVTATGHISASVVGTLSINEMRAISFGNFAVNCLAATCLGDATIYLDPTGVRTATAGPNDNIILLNGGGNAGGGGAIGGRAGDPGSQAPGHYTVTGGAEGNASNTQVYISFADSNGAIVDACSPPGSVGGIVGGVYFSSSNNYTGGTPGTCDNYHRGNFVQLTGPTANAFTVDKFTFNESGSDVYGHYIGNKVPDSGGQHQGVGPGSANPFLPGSAPGSGHDLGASAGGVDGEVDVVVGGMLHTAATAQPTAGRYTGTFDIMVSY